ncbi:MAG TPA: OB-fold nucleic acid binding domain-containing protein [archaeon]|nr:OB-fold nucleic acid binding domain-containing protein [archaeon]
MDLLVEKISKESGVDKGEVEKKILEKQEELSGLISMEGAAYIVGRELGVNLIKEGKRELKIKNLVAGLNAVDINLEILRIFEKRNYEKNGKKGSVLNILVGDDTGKTRLVLWGDDTGLVEENNLAQGDLIKVTRAVAKKNNLGEVEIGLSKGGAIEKVGKSEFQKGAKTKSDFNMYTRTELADIKDGYWEIKGCVVQVLKRNPFFFVCPKCDGKLDGKTCGKDGEVEPKKQLIISVVVDDGTGTIRTVFFRELAQKLVGKTEAENQEEIYGAIQLGRELVIKGRVKKSNFSGELEMVVNSVEDVDVRKEAEKILEELETTS